MDWLLNAPQMLLGRPRRPATSGPPNSGGQLVIVPTQTGAEVIDLPTLASITVTPTQTGATVEGA